MVTCTQCGAPLKENSRFCTECGTTVTAAEPAAHTPVQPVSPPPRQAVQGTPVTPPTRTSAAGDDRPAPGSKYEPITTGGLIGSMLLMAIPVVGLVITIIWACGGCRKIQKRYLARAALVFMVIGLIISILLGIATKMAVDKVKEAAGIPEGQSIADVLNGLSGSGAVEGGQSDQTSQTGIETGSQNGLSNLLSLLQGLGSLSGENGDTGDLNELMDVLGQLDSGTVSSGS